MEKSKELEFLNSIKVAAEYSILITKMKLLNEAERYSKSISKDEFINLVNGDNILYTKEDKEYEDIRVFIPATDSEDRFSKLSLIVSNPNRLDAEPIKDGRYIKAITSTYFNNLYDNICDRLNAIEDQYNEVVKNIQQ